MASALTEAQRSFVALVQELRASGAMRVRDGGLEVVFTEPVEKAADGRPTPRVTYSKKEEDELAALRREREQLEELGVL